MEFWFLDSVTLVRDTDADTDSTQQTRRCSNVTPVRVFSLEAIGYQVKIYVIKMVNVAFLRTRRARSMLRPTVVTAAMSIANIVKSSLGPLGLDKMMVDNIGVSIVMHSHRNGLTVVFIIGSDDLK